MKINADSQRFSFYNEKQALTPSISTFFEWNSAQHKSVPQELFCRLETQFTGAAWLIHPQPSHLLICMWIATPKPEGQSIGVEWNTQIHPSPGPSALDQQLHAPTPLWDAATATHFRGIKHISTFLQNEVLDHKNLQDRSCLLPIGVLKKVILSIHWFKTTTPATARSRRNWTSRTCCGLLSKVTLGEANNALCAAPVQIFCTQLSNFTVNYIFIKAYVLHNSILLLFT